MNPAFLHDAAAMLAASQIAHPEVLIVVGFLAGMLGAMLGIGGGAMIVPALIYAAGFGERMAIATSLAAMIPMSIVAAGRQRRYGNLRLRAGLTIGVFGIAGAALGATLADVLPEQVLRIGFALLLLFIAAQMLLRLRRDHAAAAR